MSEKEKREFKGIWIPAEIWLKKELSVLERGLYAEIDSFDRTGSGCYAGNDYFAEFFGVSAPSIARAIKKLLKKEVIVRAGYRNRKRILKVNKQFFLDFYQNDNRDEKYQNDNRDLECQNDKSTSIKMIGLECQNDKHINTVINPMINNKEMKPIKKEYMPDVFLTGAEYERLIKNYHRQDVDNIIEDLSNALGNRYPKNKYKDHNKTVRNWLKLAKIEKKKPDKICPDCGHKYLGSGCQECGWSR